MGLNRNHYKRFEMELKAAYRRRRMVDISGKWKSETMDRIRLLESHNAEAGYLLVLEQLLWRLAPLACVLIFICAVGLFNLDICKGFEMAELFLDDPVEYIVAQGFGM